MSAEANKAGSGEQNQDAQSKDMQNRSRLEKSISVAQKVLEAQKSAASLKERAYNAVNPKERVRLLQEAYHKEVEAHGQSKLAKRLQSGVWQGGTAGGGIGAGIAMGLGAVTGTLVSGLVSVPTVLLGGLVGAGVGGIHGPWFTFGGGGNKKDKQTSDEEVRAKAMQEAEALDQAVETGASTVPQPPKMDEGDAEDPGESEGRATPTSERKKPRKLQVRSGNEVMPTQERKKPRKLEVRSMSERNENL